MTVESLVDYHDSLTQVKVDTVLMWCVYSHASLTEHKRFNLLQLGNKLSINDNNPMI